MHAKAGQVLTVKKEATFLAFSCVWYGNVYGKGMLAGDSDPRSTATVTLPQNGDYKLDIGPTMGSQKKFDYTLTVSVK